ncbi:MAG TPA: GerMN domain-containing protein [Candidatus Paceibacterota bacterium]|nr:GerMN domain-containing protein [Candidatus Paceibacterota bacterium]
MNISRTVIAAVVILVIGAIAYAAYSFNSDDFASETPVKLYYYNPALDQGPGGVQCSRQGLVAVNRAIPETTMPLTKAIELLLRGEITPQEQAQGIESEFPLAGVALTSAVVEAGVATLTFADPQNKTSGGSCRVAILRAQIEETAKQFETVESVRLMPEEVFQP